MNTEIKLRGRRKNSIHDLQSFPPKSVSQSLQLNIHKLQESSPQLIVSQKDVQTRLTTDILIFISLTIPYYIR